MNWQDDKSWSDRFIPRICQIVGPRLLVPAPFERDAKENADLIVLKARDLTVACRVRRPGYSNFKNQFTIRSARVSGAKTELDKLSEGWGDWMFYAHSNDAQDGFACWHLIDLSAWRCHLIRSATRKAVHQNCGTTSNGDGTSFVWFDIAGFVGEPAILVASG